MKINNTSSQIMAALLAVSLLAGGIMTGCTPASNENPTDSIEQTDSETEAESKDTAAPIESGQSTDPIDTEPQETQPQETDPKETQPKETTPPSVDPSTGGTIDGDYVYRTNVTEYLPYLNPSNAEEYLVLANREHPLGESYAPTDLDSLDSKNSLRHTAYMAYLALLQEMKAYGMKDSYAQSTYRPYSTQNVLYNRYLAEERANHPGYSEEQVIALVDSYSARPGTSDHQTGLAIDFSPISTAFEKTKAFQFLTENGYKFGFILRFPQNKTDITGYMYESWHWRFVGREAATYIHEHNITLEEYLEERA